MDYALKFRAGGFLFYDSRAYHALLTLAERYGWQPAGTTRYLWRGKNSYVVNEAWNGEYRGNGGQEVSATDAANLADALERALEDCPDVTVVKDQASPQADEFREICDQGTVRRFIRCCHAGGFFIL